MRICLLSIALIALLMTPIECESNGNDFLSFCNQFIRVMEDSLGEVDDMEVGMCIGFIGTSQEFIQVWQYESGWPEICLPDGVEVDQLARVFVKYLEEHPERLHERQMRLLIDSFRIAFPCTGPN